MTPRQRKFCDEYIISGNATQAAIKAGYSAKTAGAMGSENLEKPELKSYIEAELEKLHSAKIADAAEVLEYLTAVMRGETVGTEIVTEFIGDGISEARTMDKGPSEKDRLKAAELIGKRFGLFTDRVGIDGAVPVVIKDDIPDED